MASATDTARSGIEGRLSSNITSIDATWTAAANVAWPGVDFTPPTEWVRPTILWGEGFLETMSSGGTNTVVGVFVMEFYARPGSGLGTLYGWADAARDLYDRVTVGSVEFLAADGPLRVNEADTEWLQLNVRVPFILEETS